MKIIVTHSSPDWDAIGSVWILKRFLPGWENAHVEFVPAGQRSSRVGEQKETLDNPILLINDSEIVHVDTGFGPLDHHQTNDKTTCGAQRSWEYVLQNQEGSVKNQEKWNERKEAIDRMMKVIVAIDHFQEVFWPQITEDYQEFSFLGILEGLKVQHPNDDEYYVTFGMQILDAVMHNVENRIWAERELKEKGKEFRTRFGIGLGIISLNDNVIKLAQKMGYVLVVRKDPRKGYVRIKARPVPSVIPSKVRQDDKDIDLTLVYEQLAKMDPQATWYLHVSKKMLLNGTPKNPMMRPTTLSLEQIVKVVEKI